MRRDQIWQASLRAIHGAAAGSAFIDYLPRLRLELHNRVVLFQDNVVTAIRFAAVVWLLVVSTVISTLLVLSKEVVLRLAVPHEDVLLAVACKSQN